jgi:hypothetical protein
VWSPLSSSHHQQISYLFIPILFIFSFSGSNQIFGVVVVVVFFSTHKETPKRLPSFVDRKSMMGVVVQGFLSLFYFVTRLVFFLLCVCVGVNERVTASCCCCFPPLGKNRVVENKIKKREGRTNINERETKTSEERKRVGTQTSKRLNKQMKAVLQTGWKKKRE